MHICNLQKHSLANPSWKQFYEESVANTLFPDEEVAEDSQVLHDRSKANKPRTRTKVQASSSAHSLFPLEEGEQEESCFHVIIYTVMGHL